MRTTLKHITFKLITVVLAVMLGVFCGFSQGAISYLAGFDAYAAGFSNTTNQSVDASAGNTNENTGGSGSASEDKYYIDSVLVEDNEPDELGVWHFLDEEWESAAYRPLTITQKGKTVQLNGWYTDNHGNLLEAADSTSQLGVVELKWTVVSQNPKDPSYAGGIVAQVDPTGLVTPVSNGSVVIRCAIADPTKYQGATPYKDVTIVFDGQDGEYVSQVDILDSNGNIIGSRWGGITVYTDKNTYYQLYVKVTWVNASGQVIREENTFNGDRISTTVTWNVAGSTEPFTINEETGRLRTSEYSGNAYVICKAVGGVGGKEITDTANIQLDTGQYHYNPSETLTLKVSYEERPDEIMYEKTYSYEELKSRLTSNSYNYTMLSGSRYGVISAKGWLFKDLIHMLEKDSNADGGKNVIDDDDIQRFSFGTSDGYNNPVSWSMLFDVDRWYYPNYDLGGSHAEGVVVPPMLAYASNATWGESEADPTKELDESMRFRLVFGCLSDDTMNSAYQIYYINTIKIVLEGGPPVDPDPPSPDPTPTPDPTPNNGSGGGTGGGSGSGDGIVGSGVSSSSGDGAEQASLGGGQSAKSSGDTGNSPSKQWRIYQVMSANNSDIGEWDFDNPLSPFVIPGVLLSLIAGGLVTFISFRRRLS